MTSLQRASQASKLETSKGAFENSFAAGLDLSEFGVPSNNTQPSAAAELLRVKAQQAQQAALEDNEEVRIQGLAKARAQHLQAAIAEDLTESSTHQHGRHAAPHESQRATDLMEATNLSATLIHMHGQDVQQGGHHKQKLSHKRTRRDRKTRKSGGAKAVKRSIRCKH